METLEKNLPSLALTGVSGRVGGNVARILSRAGVQTRLLARSPERIRRLEGARVVPSTYRDTEQTRASLAGVKTLFMVSGAESADRLDQHRQFILAAADSGVEHLVYTSFYGADRRATFTLARDHAETERYIRDSGMKFTFVRDNFYQDIFPLFASDGVIAGPAGDGRVSAVAVSDVAAVAARVVQDPADYADSVLSLTGPESLSLAEIAETISRVTGEKTVYKNETLDQARRSRLGYGVQEWQMDAWISTYTAIAAGELAEVTGTVEMVLGRQAQSLEETLRRSLSSL